MRRRTFFALAVMLAAVAATVDTRTTLPRSTPEAQGISSAGLLGFIEEAEQKLDALHSIMVVRHGSVVAEGWWAPYAANEPHQMFSLSKSFTSTAVGLAIAEGKLKVDDPVLKFFPDEAPAQPGANLRAMRVRDLLTMSTGHHEDDVRAFPYNSEQSLVKQFLERPVSHKPGTFFFYNTPASYMLSAIVQKVTGQPVLEYLGPRIFQPLGIEGATWDASRQGVSLGGFGLNIRTEDIARFGQLYLQKGKWQGKQLVPEAWVDEATTRWMSNGSSPTSDWEQGYGYQFWRSRHGFYRGDGAHGQFCLILPQYDTVIAITSGTRDMGSVMNLVWDRLVPLLEPAARAADAAANKKLTAKLASLTLKAPAGTTTSPAATAAKGKRYTFESNPLTIESLSVDAASGAGDVTLALRLAGADQTLTAGHGKWHKGTLKIAADGVAEAIAASGAWTSPDTYAMAVARYRTPFVTTYKLRFAGEQLFVTAEANVPATAKPVEIVGRRATSSAAR